MTTEAAPAVAKPAKGTTAFKASEDHNRDIPIAEILSNQQNPRESAPQLLSLGYGLFAKQEGSDKAAVVPLALSSKNEDKAEYVKAIEKFEPSIAEMAADILVNGLIEPIRVRAMDTGYDLVVGCRRVLAVLYNHCKTGSTPARIKAIVTDVDDTKALYMSFSENAHRMDMSPIEQAKWFATMKNGGLKINEIADKTKIDHQVVRQRLELLKLSQEDQDKVHDGELGVVKALKIVKGKSDTKNPTAKTRGGKATSGGANGEERRRVPTLAKFKEMYETREDLHEKVREWMALEILEVEYVSFKELAKMKADQEKAEAAAKEKADKEKEKAATAKKGGAKSGKK